ncbi:Mn2+/Fe2+ NRAMP family transporter [Hymenobacter luteus]|uniref:Mn2+/Fe2+ NRAMP family transporter n=2 Tax=Hymenobacter TaxID=89966 RepID=A0A7W9T3D6_9BACT|nr:NRAMP family divalent metal transporter [Hymenobacter latericoloratus]MBB4601852.1 Mn2+/Fe2+ NRAMP family transporter [Hymenobacter latericoloratus]MBB6059719.1 Mn2+/Fe2+ NRAMP family transporter [Hymenobacter luteus]
MRPARNWGVLLGAAFLMATSAVGPGFLTQTTVFTQSLGASFGFVILTSILIDIGVQLNIWRVIAVSELRAPDIANRVLPGLGGFISLLIVLGGLAFNIGNVGGAGLGLEVLTGLPVTWCAVLAAGLAIAVFLVREAGPLMDRFAQLMGLVMILAIIYVAVVTQPPVAEAALRTVVPAAIDYRAIITLVGGTVGGYITFSGGHRLLDAGIKGPAALLEVSRSAIMGVSVASLIRVLLFLATLGVVARGLAIEEGNPTASVFQLAAGSVGYKLFGVVMFAAAITSIIGSAYTSVSFLKSMRPGIATHENRWIIGFIVFSTLVFVGVGKPVSVLVWAGALNGFILPITLGTLLVAAYRPSVVGSYRHPLALTVFGVLVVLLMTCMSGAVLLEQVAQLGK